MMLRKAFVFAFLTIVFAVPATAQRRPTVVKPKPKLAVAAAEISSANWNTLAEALEKEDWNRAAELAALHLTALKTENPKKQLAQLRYIRMIALSGVAVGLNGAGKTEEAAKVLSELDGAALAFVGKEFVMPAREFAADCSKKLNYICRVKDSTRALRTVATSREGDAILSFDYIIFDLETPALSESGLKVALGGMLERVDFNEDPSKPWAIRMYFTKGFVFDPK